jgi:hypothetical protein
MKKRGLCNYSKLHELVSQKNHYALYKMVERGCQPLAKCKDYPLHLPVKWDIPLLMKAICIYLGAEQDIAYHRAFGGRADSYEARRYKEKDFVRAALRMKSAQLLSREITSYHIGMKEMLAKNHSIPDDVTSIIDDYTKTISYSEFKREYETTLAQIKIEDTSQENNE